MSSHEEPPSYEELRPVVARLRKAKGLSLERLAHRTVEVDPAKKGLTHGALSHNTTGKHAPRPRTLELIAAALDVEPETFVDYRLAQAKRVFDARNPELGGVGFEQAIANLAAFEKLVGLMTGEREALPGADAALEAAEEAARQAVARRRQAAQDAPAPPGNGHATGSGPPPQR